MRSFHRFDRSELLPHRFVFQQSGAPENMGPDEAGEGGGGVSEAAAEAAAEERRQAAAAAKKQRKDEKKVKKRENKLAEIIEKFLNGAARDDKMAILISRLLERNTPPAIILAIMSLNFSDVVETLEDYREEEAEVIPDEGPNEPAADTSSLVKFGEELSQALSVWTKRIFVHASFRPMKSILALAHHHGVDHGVIQLTGLMIQRFFAAHNQDIEFDRIKDFAELFWRDALKRLHKMADQRGLIPERTQDPMADEDDDDDE